jgi:hypothetical protein
MPKTKISEYSATANSNTDVASINIDEGCAPSGINNAIRAVMGHLKDFQAGTNSDSFNGPTNGAHNGSVGATTPAAGAFTTLSATGQVTSTVTTGTAPLVIASTTKVTNLNVDQLDGADWAAPPAIGSGTPAAGSFTTLSASGNVTLGDASTDTLNVGNGGIVKDASGNVGIGTSSPSTKLHVAGGNSSVASSYGFVLSSNTNTGFFPDDTVIGAKIQTDGGITFFTGGATERARIDSTGNLCIGAATQTGRLGLYGPISDFISTMYNTASSGPRGINIYYGGAAPNSTASPFFYCNDTSALRAEIRSNGGLANFSANNVNLSDERTKTDIVDAGGYLAKICAIPVRTFKYKDQTDDLLNLGVIAQEVEAVAPELVDVSGFGETPEDGVPLKAIYQTDLQYALMKCIQEQQALITTLTERITALEQA